MPTPVVVEEALSTGTTPRPLDRPKEADLERKPSKASVASHRTRASTVSSQARPITPPTVIVDADVSSKPSQVSLSSPGPKSARAVFVSHENDDAQPPHMPQSYDDPFADPVPETAPIHIYSPTSSGPGRIPEPFHMPGMLPDDEPSTEVSMPIPITEIAMPISRIQPGPSMYSLGGQSNAVRQPEPVGYETDETLPLLRQSSQAVATDGTAFPEPDTHAGPIAIFNNAFQHDADSFEKLGWRMHILPDTSVYFMHPALHVVTDMDLRYPAKMHEVTRFLGKAPLPPLDWEAWLRSGGKKHNFAPAQAWVNHAKKIVSLDRNPERMKMEDLSKEQQLEMEHRYWSYVETHPAHLLLPPTSVSEAMDMLTWSYTERLLPSTSGSIPAFSHDECQELMGILRSLEANPSPGQAVIRTHIVAKIMLRMTAWRQRDGSPDAQRNKRAGRDEYLFPIGRKAVDLAVSAVCLGIPYLFLDRSRHHRIDAESGLRSSAGPMIAVGAVACMIVSCKCLYKR
ncbi:hypothetical protein OF83DRAFT_1105870 [Amylostereum chailletii]|nr:hypothetical protein OF83DRAFT_1105870 [Amylostereum chailletii]